LIEHKYEYFSVRIFWCKVRWNNQLNKSDHIYGWLDRSKYFMLNFFIILVMWIFFFALFLNPMCSSIFHWFY
jgi:hypothetical protein